MGRAIFTPMVQGADNRSLHHTACIFQRNALGAIVPVRHYLCIACILDVSDCWLGFCLIMLTTYCIHYTSSIVLSTDRPYTGCRPCSWWDDISRNKYKNMGTTSVICFLFFFNIKKQLLVRNFVLFFMIDCGRVVE